MDVKETIEKRRSIRKFKPTAISDDIIVELLKAARLAPSGCNVQPWKYFIVKDAKTKKKLKEKKVFGQNFFYKAPLIIVCCGAPGAYSSFKGVQYQIEEGSLPKDLTELERSVKGREVIRTIRDVSIASSYIVLRATELGLGTCYVGWVDKKKLKEALDIPNEYIIPFVICVGYPDESPQPRPRKSLDELLID